MIRNNRALSVAVESFSTLMRPDREPGRTVSNYKLGRDHHVAS
jgi:hypothetical protein